MQAQFIRYIFAGLLNTVFGYTIFVAFIFVGLEFEAALFFTYIFGMAFNLLTSKRLVFKKSKSTPVLKFIIFYIAIYFVNILLSFAVDVLESNPLVIQAICQPVIALLSFYLLKFKVFKDLDETN